MDRKTKQIELHDGYCIFSFFFFQTFNMMPKLSIYMYFVRIVVKFYDGQQI